MPVETDTAFGVSVQKTITVGEMLRRQEEDVVNFGPHFRRQAVKDRRIAIQEKRIIQLEFENESHLAEKQRILSPITPPDNDAWNLD